MRPTIAFAALVALSLAGCLDRPAPKPVVAATTVQTYSRDEFRQLVMGKTPEEVIAAVGKPENTQGSETRPMWVYKRLTVDPVTAKVDEDTFIFFHNGKVESVHH